ncbi:MAG: DinB family protein [Anaerolineales bacterium]
MKITTQPSTENISTLLDLLRGAPARLDALAFGQGESALIQPPGEGQRSFREILTHLLNSEARLTEAVYQILLLKEPNLPQIHPERDWGKLMSYQKLGLADLLGYFKLRRLLLLSVLEKLSTQEWLRTGREAGKKRQESVYWKTRTLVLHEIQHLSELEERIGEC